MAVNLAALKKLQEDFDNGRNDLFFFANSIKEDTDIRLLPPLKNMNGIWFFEQIGYWIEKKFYLSPETFGKPCPIAQEVEDAEAEDDKDLNELLNDNQSFSKKSRYMAPVLVLECEFDKKGVPEKVSVVDKKAKIMVSGQMLVKSINKIWVNRQYQNGTEDGIADRVEGYNIIISKSGKKLNTEYSAIGWKDSWEMPEKYYDEKEIPDIVAMSKKDLKSDDYLRAIVRNYLYGEPLPKDDKVKDEDEDEAPKRKKKSEDEDEAPRRKRPAAEPEDDDMPKRGRKDSEEEEDEKPKRKRAVEPEDDDDELPKRKKKPVEDEEPESKPKKGGKRSLLDDLNDLD